MADTRSRVLISLETDVPPCAPPSLFVSDRNTLTAPHISFTLFPV